MKKPDKNDFYKLYSNVIVGCAVNSSNTCKQCSIKKNEFSIFLGTEKRLSTLYTSCCDDCLPSVLRNIIDVGNKNVEKYYNAACKKYYDECLQYVRKTKIDNLGNITENNI